MSFWERIIPKSGPAATSSRSGSSLNHEDASGFKFNGFTEGRTRIPLVEILPDQQLEELNSILKWNCFVVDSQGRRFGSPHSSLKRQIPQEVPDTRIVMMDKRFQLKNSSVLELGCFEGVHTVALAQRAASVIAVDSRLENVVKTMVRTGFFNQQARVMCCDLEALTSEIEPLLKADFAHHVGVLYHLKDPVGHILKLGELIGKGIMLDTHFSNPDDANKSYHVNELSFSYRHFVEAGGYAGVFSGMYDHAKWLTLEGLTKALQLAGFAKVEIIETRAERNGPRVLLFAEKQAQ